MVKVDLDKRLALSAGEGLAIGLLQCGPARA